MATTIEATLRHVLFLARHLNNCSPKCVAVVALLELGIPTKLVGFDLLEKAIVISCEQPELMTTKEVFLAIGQQYTSALVFEQIDQAVRTAISDAWKCRDDDVWRCYFPQVMANGMRKPTNAEFVSQLAKFVELWEECRKKAVYER